MTRRKLKVPESLFMKTSPGQAYHSEHWYVFYFVLFFGSVTLAGQGLILNYYSTIANDINGGIIFIPHFKNHL